MNKLAEDIWFAIETNNKETLDVLIKTYPNAITIYEEFSFIINGLENLKQEQFKRSLLSNNSAKSIEEVWQKGIEHIQIEQMTEILKNHEKTKSRLKSTEETKVVNLKSKKKLLSIAASLLVLISAAFWIWPEANSPLELSEFVATLPSTQIRSVELANSNNDLSLWVQKKDWEKILQSCSRSKSQDLTHCYWCGTAALYMGNGDDASYYLNLAKQGDQYPLNQYAEYNHVLALYALNSPEFEISLKLILDDKDHLFLKKAESIKRLLIDN